MGRIGVDEIKDLVRPDRVHRRVYTDPEIFELEMSRIFGRVWLYVAHESQIKNAGDFVRSRLGRHEVIVIRNADGKIHALHNRCAHRGARLCLDVEGNSRSLLCPYHGWSFRPDGSLEGVPHRQGYPATFSYDDTANHLQRVPRVDTYRGFVFASLAADGPSLRDYLGPIADAIDNLNDRAPDGEVEVADSRFEWDFQANWKLPQENSTDEIHPGFAHESAVAAARGMPVGASSVDGDQTRQALLGNALTVRDWERVMLVAFPGGHGYMTNHYDASAGMLAPQTNDPVRREYRAALVARYGEARTAEILAVDRFNNNIYPNIALNAVYQQIRIQHPVAVDRTIVVSHCFRLKGAPEAMFHRAIRFLTNVSSPASNVFADDLEIFSRCQAGMTRGGEDWINVARGIGIDRLGNDGSLSAPASEVMIRAQFTAWLDYMTTETVQ